MKPLKRGYRIRVRPDTQTVRIYLNSKPKELRRGDLNYTVRASYKKSATLNGGAKEPIKAARKAVKLSVKQDQEQYCLDSANELEHMSKNDNTKKMFKSLRKKINGKIPSTANTLEGKCGEIIRSEEGQLERWREHFSELLNPVNAL
ncbi:hypothetical protein QYM36_007671 [Artemia franciscana]|uniref:Uncharacterized protein n=1 Tax=Artemia franciscana TaxID=6661 RepID=A0AA88IN94_ARTSF|nr:hypothetical protein QYM36_007671 [Artemia franciscana]